jgi:hypothetical protein
MEDIQIMAKCSDALISLAARMRAVQGVRNASRGTDVRSYSQFEAFEAFVEVETASNRRLTWWVELHRHRDRWAGEAVILEMKENDQMRLRQLSSFEATDRGEMEKNWSTLLSSIERSLDPALLA